MSNRKLKSIYLVVYFIVFYALWVVRELLLRPVFDSNFSNIGFAVIETVTKLIIWTIPAIYLIKIFHIDMYVDLKEMFTRKIKWSKYLLIIIGFLIYQLLITYFSYGIIEINSAFRIETLISSVLFVGITEEIVFRGWLLNATLGRIKPWLAVIINAILFLTIHFPLWIYNGQFFNISMVLKNGIAVILLSIIFSWTFIKSRSIFAPILLHMSWNLFSNLFAGG